MDIYIIVGLVAWILFTALVICAAALGSRLDDRTEQDTERERHYTNVSGVYDHPRSLRR